MQFWADEIIEINDIRYENSILEREQYITNGRGKENNTSIDNVIVITVDFTVVDNGNSAYNKGEYKDYSMILIRDSKGGQWLIDDMGY